MQTRRQSAIESCVNIGSGMVIAWSVTQFLAWSKLFGLEIHISPGSNIVLTIILTVVSAVRSYYWRRYFNNLEKRNDK